MNHQTLNSEGDISAHIGALELAAITSFDDGAFEATIHTGPNAQVTLLRNSRRGCEFVELKDDALEASVLLMVSPTPTFDLSCLTRVRCGPRIDDGMLEATVQAGPQRPTVIRVPGGCLPGVDDSTLEATFQGGPSTMRPACPFIDDGMLEAVAPVLAGPTGMTCPPPQTLRPMCRFIDDGVLETVAAHADVGPSVQRVAGHCY